METECLGEDAWSPALVTEAVSGNLPTITCLVAITDTVVGFVVLSLAGDIAELQRIAVAREARRAGTGSALLAAAVRAAADSQADRMLLEVREDNARARAFYAANDFIEVDRRPRYYADAQTAVVLRRALGRGCGSGSTC